MLRVTEEYSFSLYIYQSAFLMVFSFKVIFTCKLDAYALYR